MKDMTVATELDEAWILRGFLGQDEVFLGCLRNMVWNMVVWSAMFLGTAGTNGIIKQSPEQLTVTEGGTAQLSCSYINKINDAKKLVGAITWYKDEEYRIVSNKSSGFHGRVRTSSAARILSQSIQIVNVRMNDTGKYYCRVVLFGQEDHFGKGAQVTVTPRNPTGFGRSLRWQLIEMGVKLAVFALINTVTVFGIRTWGTYRALIATNRANRRWSRGSVRFALLALSDCLSRFDLVVLCCAGRPVFPVMFVLLAPFARSSFPFAPA
ncbi:uncharacterized protein LOC132394821 [Hypanus sabinus]|uniref:uncharacterized protein LOC132394821 n=1 Tax=Hypanus sabinus TaxID=79690 RepID=UPI0028C4DD47|nr:uncharacterized protein LOC132394821 [Hypanus sabinus]